MKTRLDKQPLYHRFSLLSDTVPKCQVSRKLQHRPIQQDKKLTEIHKQEEEHKSYLEQLRKEAFDELHVQLQQYNDEFITRMRYIEQTGDYMYKEEDDGMEELQDCLNATSVKDYSDYIEHCDTQTSYTMFL